MKVLFLCRRVDVGGVERNLLLLTEELNRNGHEVLIGANTGVLKEQLIAKGASFHDFGFELRKPIKIIADAFSLYKLIRATHPDIVHVFSAAPGIVLFISILIAFCNRQRHNFPAVVSSIMGLQASPTAGFLDTYLKHYFVTLGSQRVYLISPAIEKTAKKFPIRKERLKRLKVVGIRLPGTPIATANSLKTELGIPANDRIVITIGRLDKSKSHELFIAMAVEMLKVRADTTFLIIGVGPQEHELKMLINRSFMPGKIRMLGLRQDIYDLLSISDVCMKPGIVEGFIGITVLEAQAIGVPVVAWYTEDVTMAIDHGNTGYIINDVNILLAAKTTNGILDNDKEAKRIGLRGQEFVRNEYDIEKVAGNLLRAYEDEIQQNAAKNH